MNSAPQSALAAHVVRTVCISPQTAAAFFRFGVRGHARGYLESSVDLLSAAVAHDVIEAHGKDTSPSNVAMYLRGMAAAIIGEGS